MDAAERYAHGWTSYIIALLNISFVTNIALNLVTQLSMEIGSAERAEGEGVAKVDCLISTLMRSVNFNMRFVIFSS